MSPNRKRKPYLICYDICDPKRLRRVHRLGRDVGFPIQYSVFEAELKNSELERVISKLESLICNDEDKVYFYSLLSRSDKKAIGLKSCSEDLEFF